MGDRKEVGSPFKSSNDEAKFDSLVKEIGELLGNRFLGYSMLVVAAVNEGESTGGIVAVLGHGSVVPEASMSVINDGLTRAKTDLVEVYLSETISKIARREDPPSHPGNGHPN